MLTPALSRNWQVGYSSVKDAGMRTAVDPWHGLPQWDVRMHCQASCLRVNKEPAEQAAGACLMERLVEGTAER